MNTTTRDVLSGSDLQMPSGCEVETATFHVPVMATPAPTVHQPGMKEKIDDLKSRGLHAMHDMQRTLSERSQVMKSQLTHQSAVMKTQLSEKSAVMKTQLSEKSALMKSQLSHKTAIMKSQLSERMATAKVQGRDELNRTMTNMNTSMAMNPMKWAGIAAGSGFAIGLIGRFIHWRNKHQRRMPQLVIIHEARC